MKVYVCGPMTGLPEFNYPAFLEAEDQLRTVGYDVLNPARINEHHALESAECACRAGESHDWQWYMDRCLPMVRESDGLAVLPGWQVSRGAVMEMDLATSEVKIPIASVPTWVARHKMLQAGRFDG